MSRASQAVELINMNAKELNVVDWSQLDVSKEEIMEARKKKRAKPMKQWSDKDKLF